MAPLPQAAILQPVLRKGGAAPCSSWIQPAMRRCYTNLPELRTGQPRSRPWFRIRRVTSMEPPVRVGLRLSAQSLRLTLLERRPCSTALAGHRTESFLQADSFWMQLATFMEARKMAVCQVTEPYLDWTQRERRPSYTVSPIAVLRA